MKRVYGELELEWLKENYPKLGGKKTIVLFKENFGKKISLNALYSFASKQKIIQRDIGYTEEQIEWLKLNGGKKPYKELTEEFNQIFNETKTYEGIRAFCLRNLKVFVGKNAFTKIKYENDLIKIYLANIDKTIKEIVKIFNEKHHTKYSKQGIESALNRRGYYKKNYGHKQGNTHNDLPLGTIRVTSNGFEIIKVKLGTKAKNYEDGFIRLSNYKYEQYYGENVGPKEMVIFANGNNRDYRKENLVKITWSERLQLNQAHAIGNEEYMRTMLEIIRTKQKIREVANAKH